MKNYIQGRLMKNDDGRYAIEGGPVYYTSGEPIEFYDEDKGEWIQSSVEHAEDYYIVDLGTDVPMDFIIARYK